MAGGYAERNARREACVPLDGESLYWIGQGARQCFFTRKAVSEIAAMGLSDKESE